MTDRERIELTLNAVRDGLVPLIERELAARKGYWREATKTDGNWRAGTYVPNVQLGVDCLDDGTMRVHVCSEHVSGVRSLRALEQRFVSGELDLVPGTLEPRTRLGPNGRKLYFGFECERPAARVAELARTESLVEWFVRTRDRIEWPGA